MPKLASLYERRPTVDMIRRWIGTGDSSSLTLEPSSAYLFGQICKELWKYCDQVRQLDTTQPVEDQILLSRVEALLRHNYIWANRNYSSAPGDFRLYMTEEGKTNLALMQGYDPIFMSPSFDIHRAVEAIVRSTTIR